MTRSDSEGQQVGIIDHITDNFIVAIASGDLGKDYYLMKVTGHGPEELEIPIMDDWGTSYPAGAEVICGHFLLNVRGSSCQYKMDHDRKAVVYAATALFLCTDLRSLPGERIVLSEQEHTDILNSLEGF